MPPSSAGRALEALTALKKSVPGMRLKKNGGDGVFPIEIRLPITSLPPAAEAFDLPLPAYLLASVFLLRDDDDDDFVISVTSFECEGLPKKVLERAAAGLRAAVSSSPSSPFPLAALPAAAGAAFFAAVQSLAELEPYESVDASGASVRRFAVVREEADVELVVEEEKEKEEKEKAKASAAPRAAAAAAPAAAAAALPTKPSNNPRRVPFLPRRVAEASPAEGEVRFLERRFGASLSILEEKEVEEGTGSESGGEKKQQQQRRRFRVCGFVPSDPTWTHGRISLLGSIDLARYPEPGSFSLFAEAEEEEEEEEDRGKGGGSVAAARLTVALRRAAAAAASSSSSSSAAEAGDQALRALVRLADSRGGELAAEPSFSLSDDNDDDEGEGDEDYDDDETEESSSGSSETDSESESEEEGDCKASAAAAAAASPSSSSPSFSGTRFALSLASLCLDGVDALSPASLSLELSCLRCCSSFALEGSDATAPSACSTCRAPLAAAVLPRVAHASSSVVAAVRCSSGCAPKDLLLPLCSFGAQCERCSRVVALRGAAAAAVTANGGSGGSSNFALRRACPSCHASLAVLFDSVLFERLPEAGGGVSGGGGGAGAGARRRKKKKKKKDAFDDGSEGKGAPGKCAGHGGAPLPRNGACDHYPHSHRAMRFPCCFRVYACDVCHEIAAASASAANNHPAEVSSVASKMVCGFCSKEQPFEKKGEAAVCRRCGKHLAGSARFGTHGGGTRHWEGGQGCRDKTRLDRRDSKKHTGSKLKTRSKKAFRVGGGGGKKKE